MAPLKKRPFLITTLAVVGVMCAFIFWPERKPEVRLQDGTLIRIEKITTTGPAWLDRKRLKLGEIGILDGICNAVGWEMPAQYNDIVYQTTVEFFTDKPERFTPISEVPLLWLFGEPDHADLTSFDIFSTNRGVGAHGVKSGEKPGHFIVEFKPSHESPGILRQFKMHFYRRDGREEFAEIALNDTAPATVWEKKQLERFDLPDFQKLPAIGVVPSYTKKSNSNLTIEMIKPPKRDDLDGAFIVWKDGKNVTDDYYVWGHRNYRLDGVFNYWYSAFPRKLPQNAFKADIPKEDLKPDPGYAIKIHDFSNATIWTFGRGAYILKKEKCLRAAENLDGLGKELATKIENASPIIDRYPGLRVFGDKKSGEVIFDVSEPMALCVNKEMWKNGALTGFELSKYNWLADGDVATSPLRAVFPLKEARESLRFAAWSFEGHTFNWVVKYTPEELEQIEKDTDVIFLGGVRYGK